MECRTNRKKVLVYVICLIVIDLLLIFLIRNRLNNPVGELKFDLKTDANINIQMFYGDDKEFTEQKNLIKFFTGGQDKVGVEFQYDIKSDYIKLIFSPGWKEIEISDMKIIGGDAEIIVEADLLKKTYANNEISITPEPDNGIRIKPEGDNAWIVLDLSQYNTCTQYYKSNFLRYLVYTILMCGAVDLLIVSLLIVKNETNRADPNGYLAKCFRITESQKCIILAVFFISFAGALMLMPVFCPDEAARRLLSGYIYNNGKLPTGNEQDTMIYMWGFSYALRPFLPSMINGLFMKIVSFVNASERALLVASRMASVFASTGIAFFTLKTGNILFKKRISSNLMAIIICFTPQVIFLGMYQNNDSFSLFAISMEIYFLVKGYKNSWDIRTCIGLGISYSIAVLCYYSIAPWLLFGACFCAITCIKDSNLKNKFIFICSRGLLIILTVLVLAGWFYIRNALLHNGDFLGIYSEEISRRAVSESGLYQLIDFNRGYLMADSIIAFLKCRDYEWIRWSLRSMIGCFGHMEIWLPMVQYGEYYALIIIAVLGILLILKYKRKVFFPDLLWFLMASSFATILLSLYQSYYRDYEPQGRYIITVWLLIGYVFAFTFDNIALTVGNCDDSEDKKAFIEPSYIISALWLIMFLRIWFESMSKMIS